MLIGSSHAGAAPVRWRHLEGPTRLASLAWWGDDLIDWLGGIGDPHSPWPTSREPCVRHHRNGQALDIFGSPVSKRTLDAHISPLDWEWVLDGMIAREEAMLCALQEALGNRR